VLALTRVGAVELARFGIRVNSLLPGATMSPMARELTRVMEARGIPTASQMIGRMGLLGRMAEPVEMASMALFLASDEASFTTGAEFVNDGGWMAMSGIESKSAQ
jgi:NAD(P)-dependent dehydrogenase (short-subunit alcohol dehydrogenase family)